MSRRVLIAGGGTGGHIFPGLAVAEELARRSIEVHWLGARRGLEKELVTDRGIPLTMVEIEGMHARSPSAALRAISQLPTAVATAVRLILHLQPEALLGVGGYASAAGVMAAGLLGLPWMLQEQNSVPGWTNKVLSPWADLVCCGFSDAVAHFPSQPAIWTGNPVRDQFFRIGDLGKHDEPHLLVLGGSQGSLFLNRSIPRAIAALHERGSKVQVRHQAGKRWIEVVKTAYADLGVQARVEAFLTEPWEALGEADLVVARSGALTVSELAATGRCGLLIPFAAAAGNHQEFNARSFERAGGAVVL
ncbi:MAG: undecaprenyldiphospho-muramoylpentapeptide beta-N-acetylglucosaminyltransferase, partial [Thermoanaerobaculales bacterium]|nr:undecaprenyldiphospho-muramoylpentapeptide beta-N-acetylglucosaminyltransferase [Thermoanaerobaculales bacterium]